MQVETTTSETIMSKTAVPAEKAVEHRGGKITKNENRINKTSKRVSHPTIVNRRQKEKNKDKIAEKAGFDRISEGDLVYSLIGKC